jgi:predicted acylesterase/phospholipase RssA
MTIPSDPRDTLDRETVLVDLALQGGGSHGAFTWGVLDRLLQETRFKIEGVSGTSAGAMNAAVLAEGYAAGEQKAHARRWRNIGDMYLTRRASARSSAARWIGCSRRRVVISGGFRSSTSNERG